MKVGLLFFRKRLGEGQPVPGRSLGGRGQCPPHGDTPGSLGCTLARLHGRQGGQLGHSFLSHLCQGEGNTPKAEKLHLSSAMVSPLPPQNSPS